MQLVGDKGVAFNLKFKLKKLFFTFFQNTLDILFPLGIIMSIFLDSSVGRARGC